jgi:CRP-like cAMP-binding protein
VTIAECIARSKYFEGLDHSLVDALAFAFRDVTYRGDHDLIRQGEAGKTLYLVVEGEVAIVAQKEDGDHEIARVGPGSLLGLLALTDGESCSITCRTAGTVRVGELGRDAFTRLVNVRADIGHSFRRALGRQLAGDFRRLTAPTRTGRTRTQRSRAVMAWG